MSSTPIDVTISMSGTDFAQLASNSGEWASADWEQVSRGRFVPRDGSAEVLSTWQRVYWFDQWADVILARNFLAATGHAHQVCSDEYWDEASNTSCGWVVLTDFTAPDFEPLPDAPR